jgi:uncharacterized protein YecT (DUF1311 family)
MLLKLCAPWLVLASLACAACAAPLVAKESPAGCDALTTPAEISACQFEKVTRLEAELAAEYERTSTLLETVVVRTSGDTGTGRTLVEEFRRSQDAWLAYKEAQCSYAYATAMGGVDRGSHAMNCLQGLLEERIARVRAIRQAWEQPTS